MKALISNKEDTALAISMIGELQEEKDNLKTEVKTLHEQFNAYVEFADSCIKKEKRAMIVGNIMIPATTVPMIVAGSVLMATNNDFGAPVLYSGIGLLVGCELVWNGGHFIFKVW